MRWGTINNLLLLLSNLVSARWWVPHCDSAPPSGCLCSSSSPECSAAKQKQSDAHNAECSFQYIIPWGKQTDFTVYHYAMQHLWPSHTHEESNAMMMYTKSKHPCTCDTLFYVLSSNFLCLQRTNKYSGQRTNKYSGFWILLILKVSGMPEMDKTDNTEIPVSGTAQIQPR